MDTQQPPSIPAPLVRARGLRLTVPAAAGPVNILAGIDLDVGTGEAVGHGGAVRVRQDQPADGAGRAGTARPAAACVVAGQEMTGLGEDALARLRRDDVGIVFQAFHLIPTMTALENVALPLELAGVRDAAARAADSLRAVGLGHRLGHLPGQLSGGEQQRVALARAFAPAPRLLLADEPTGNLDVATGRAVMDLLFAMQARLGTTLLLITHDPALAARCGRQRAHRRRPGGRGGGS